MPNRRTSTDDIRTDIERTRSELGGAINIGTSEVREHTTGLHRDLLEVLNRGFDDLRAESRQIRSRLDQTTAELADARQQLLTLRAEAAESRNPQRPVAAGATAEPDDHYDLLQLAAGTAYVELVCHRDAWDWIVGQAAPGEHFRLPGDVTEEDDGRIGVDISGRTLIDILDALWRTRQGAHSAGTRALAQKIYERMGDALKEITNPPNELPVEQEPASEPEERPVVRITIDDRP